MPARLVVLVSGSGTNLQALLDATADPAYGATIVAVGADKPGILGLTRAADAKVPTFVVAPGDFPDRAGWDAALADAIAAHEPDVVVSAGFMRILGPAVLMRFPHRILNTHPALLPAFPGAHAVRDALAYGATVTGVTVHIIDAGVDTGPVIAQRAVDIEPSDTEDVLHERIKNVERGLLVDVVQRFAAGGYRLEGRKVVPQ